MIILCRFQGAVPSYHLQSQTCLAHQRRQKATNFHPKQRWRKPISAVQQQQERKSLLLFGPEKQVYLGSIQKRSIVLGRLSQTFQIDLSAQNERALHSHLIILFHLRVTAATYPLPESTLPHSSEKTVSNTSSPMAEMEETYFNGKTDTIERNARMNAT